MYRGNRDEKIENNSLSNGLVWYPGHLGSVAVSPDNNSLGIKLYPHIQHLVWPKQIEARSEEEKKKRKGKIN